MENLDWQTAIKEIVIAEKYLRHEGSSKVASIGFCMGKRDRLSPAMRVVERSWGGPSPEMHQVLFALWPLLLVAPSLMLSIAGSNLSMHKE